MAVIDAALEELLRGKDDESISVALMLDGEAGADLSDIGHRLLQRSQSLAGVEADGHQVMDEIGVLVVSAPIQLVRHLVNDPAVTMAAGAD